MIFKLVTEKSSMGIRWEIARIWMLKNLTNEKLVNIGSNNGASDNKPLSQPMLT